MVSSFRIQGYRAGQPVNSDCPKTGIHIRNGKKISVKKCQFVVPNCGKLLTLVNSLLQIAASF